MLLWGVLVGAGTGATSMILAAIIATRWFDAHRGLVLGALSAANATGQLVFLPLLASLAEQRGWRTAALVVAAAAALVFLIVMALMRDRPEDLGLKPYGARESTVAAGAGAVADRRAGAAVRSRAFWVLAGTFFICGASTNGLIGTHLIAACHDHGIPAVRAAGLLAMMGLFDILGTTASGWLTDRLPSRHLLFGYYTLRGLSLLWLPFTLDRAAGSAGSPCSTASTGSPPCRRRCASPPRPSAARTPASSTAGSARAIKWARRSRRSGQAQSGHRSATIRARSGPPDSFA